MCSGTGVLSYGYSSVACSPCKGSGYVSASKAAQLRRSLQQIDMMTGGGGYNGTSIQYGNGGNGGSRGGSSSSDNICKSCNGTGDCQHCKGTGVASYDGNYGMSGGVDKCPICHGTRDVAFVMEEDG